MFPMMVQHPIQGAPFTMLSVIHAPTEANKVPLTKCHFELYIVLKARQTYKL